jgi:hypothetical protein
MCLPPKPAPTKDVCKIKRVNRAVRSVSTPRWTKDLPVLGPVNPATALKPAQQPASPSQWRGEGLVERFRTDLLLGVRKRLHNAVEGRGTGVEQMLRSSLSEVA